MSSARRNSESRTVNSSPPGAGAWLPPLPPHGLDLQRAVPAQELPLGLLLDHLPQLAAPGNDRLCRTSSPRPR